MRRPLSTLASALASAGAVGIGGCTDAPTQPGGPDDGPVRFVVSAEDRRLLGAALAFATDHSMRALERRAAAERVTAAFESLAARVEADDRRGAERAIGAVRKAISDYRDLVGPDDSGAVLHLDAMTLALDHATEAARREAAPRSTTPSSEDRQP
jgi:hypothetical protein